MKQKCESGSGSGASSGTNKSVSGVIFDSSGAREGAVAMSGKRSAKAVWGAGLPVGPTNLSVESLVNKSVTDTQS